VPTVEAEHELVEVAWQVSRIYGALVAMAFAFVRANRTPFSVAA